MDKVVAHSKQLYQSGSWQETIHLGGSNEKATMKELLTEVWAGVGTKHLKTSSREKLLHLLALKVKERKLC